RSLVPRPSAVAKLLRRSAAGVFPETIENNSLSDAGLIRSTKLIGFPGIRIAVRIVVFEIPRRIVYRLICLDQIIERALKQNDAAAVLILHCIGANDIPRAIEQEDAPERRGR